MSEIVSNQAFESVWPDRSRWSPLDPNQEKRCFSGALELCEPLLLQWPVFYKELNVDRRASILGG